MGVWGNVHIPILFVTHERVFSPEDLDSPTTQVCQTQKQKNEAVTKKNISYISCLAIPRPFIL